MSGVEPCIWKRLTLMLKHSWGLRESSFSLCLPGCCSFRDNVPGYCRKQEQAPGEQARSAAQLSCIPLMNPPSGGPLDSSLDSLGCGYAVFCRYNRGSRYPRIRKQKKEEMGGVLEQDVRSHTCPDEQSGMWGAEKGCWLNKSENQKDGQKSMADHKPWREKHKERPWEIQQRTAQLSLEHGSREGNPNTVIDLLPEPLRRTVDLSQVAWVWVSRGC